jgi:hypothetical protein
MFEMQRLINLHHGADAHSRARYVGDGVYVVATGYDVWLYTQREREIHYIALEPVMLCEIVRLNRESVPPVRAPSNPHTASE